VHCQAFMIKPADGFERHYWSLTVALIGRQL
jgi:hypothetical protein